MQEKIWITRKDLWDVFSSDTMQRVNKFMVERGRYTKWPLEELLIIGSISGKERIGFGFSSPCRLTEPIYGIRGSTDKIVMSQLFQAEEGEFVLGNAQRIDEGPLSCFLDKAAVLFKEGIAPRLHGELWALSPREIMYGTREEINSLSGEKCEVDFKLTEFIVKCFEEAEDKFYTQQWNISLLLLKHRLLSSFPFIQRWLSAQHVSLGPAEQKILDAIKRKVQQLLNKNK